MDILTIAFLVGVGVIAGIIAAIVGGAAVVIYPALIATGVPPHLAAVSNLASVMPGTMLAALSDRSQLPPFDRAFVSLIFASIIGAGIGAVCLVLTPERVFAQIEHEVDRMLGSAVRVDGLDRRQRSDQVDRRDAVGAVCRRSHCRSDQAGLPRHSGAAREAPAGAGAQAGAHTFARRDGFALAQKLTAAKISLRPRLGSDRSRIGADIINKACRAVEIERRDKRALDVGNKAEARKDEP